MAPEKIQRSVEISICVVSNLEFWKPWTLYQIKKQVDYLKSKGIKSEVIWLSEFTDENGNKRTIGQMRNLCCERAKGKYIAIMDADDYYPSYRIYRLWLMLELLKAVSKDKSKPILEVATVDLLLCFDLETFKSFWYIGSSESCLFFTRNYFKNHKFGTERTGEGGNFAKGANIMIEDNCELIVAMSHGTNTHVREGFNEDLPMSGLPDQIWNDMSEFEKNWIKDYSINKTKFEKLSTT